MTLMENVRLALEGLRANKMRALLTMLGIIIGIGAVIGIVTVGDALTLSVTDSMSSLGSTNIMVMLQEKDSSRANGMFSSSSGTISDSDLISDDMIERYLEMYGDQVDAVSLSASGGSGRAQDGHLYANVSVSGVNEGYKLSNNVELLNGRFIREGDILSKRYVAVVSDKFVKNMFSKDINPLGQEIKVTQNNDIQTYTIIGVYKYEDSSMRAMMGGSQASEADIRTDMYIPISTCRMLTSSANGYQSITVMATADADSRQLSSTTAKFFNTYYTNNPRYRVTAMSMETMVNIASTMMGTISIAIAIIAGISLVVGGIGVMNIMLVSVTERTREIGTRKALGARNSAIRIQFIVEAVIICVIGGIFGIIVGYGLGYLASMLLGFPGTPTITIIIIAVMFSMLIGVFFGYYPANKAAKLDPIEALRYE